MKKYMILIVFILSLILSCFAYTANADDEDWVSTWNYPNKYVNKTKFKAIDVSHNNVYKGSTPSYIDWKKVKDSGVDVAIIRIAGRNEYTGKLYNDKVYEKNIKEAKDAGLKVGIYYFSAAINESEAEEDAGIATKLTKQVEDKYNIKIDLPIYMDFEDTGSSNLRIQQIKGNKDLGNKVIKKFLETVKNNGYEAGIYTNYGTSSSYFNIDEFKNSYSIWNANWGSTARLEYFNAEIWQLGAGSCSGVKGNCDRNVVFLDKPSTVKNLKCTVSENNLSKAKLTWDYIDGINTYIIEITQGGKTTKKTISLNGKSTSKQISRTVSLTTGTNKFRVRAVNKRFGLTAYGSYSSYVTINGEAKIGNTTELKFTRKNDTTAVLNWDNVKYARKYRIYKLNQTTKKLYIYKDGVTTNSLEVPLDYGNNKFVMKPYNDDFGTNKFGTRSNTALIVREKNGVSLESVAVISPKSGIYGTGKKITMVATFSENIYSNASKKAITSATAPTLKLKFGTGTERTATFSSAAGKKITYTYKITNGDDGKLIGTGYGKNAKIYNADGKLTTLDGNNSTIAGYVIKAQTSNPLQFYQKGDINGDGKINISDVLKLRRYIANSTKWNLSSAEKSRADLNGDGKINISDVLKLRRYIAANSNYKVIIKHSNWTW